MQNQQFLWKGIALYAIPGHPGYAASEDGRIWSAWRFSGRPQLKQVIRENAWKELKPDIRKIDGRRRFTLKAADGTYRRKYASHFILETFVGPRPDGMEACHNNGDCTNDSRDNLRWDTSKNNKADMVTHGTRPAGERHPKAKLSDHEVTVVLQRRRDGESPSQIARRFGVTRERIYQICKKGRR